MTSKTIQQYSQTDYEYVTSLLSGLDIPSNKILFPHVRLKGLKQKNDILNLEYEALTQLLLDSFTDVFQPKTILVPTFTYSFTNSGIYHRNFSKSEVGRFSEEVRRKFATYRTPDPVFNVVDTTDHLVKLDGLDYTTAFGINTLYEYLDDQDAVIVNFDINKPIISTQLHQIEKLNDVPYRYDKQFEGIICHDENQFTEIDYTYFVRDLDRDPNWDRSKIREYLIEEGVLQVASLDGVKVTAIFAQDKRKYISKQLSDDPEFLIKPADKE